MCVFVTSSFKMSSAHGGRRRPLTRTTSSSEDQALNQIAREVRDNLFLIFSTWILIRVGRLTYWTRNFNADEELMIFRILPSNWTLLLWFFGSLRISFQDSVFPEFLGVSVHSTYISCTWMMSISSDSFTLVEQVTIFRWLWHSLLNTS